MVEIKVGSPMGIRGVVSGYVTRVDGSVEHFLEEEHNVITNTGLAGVASRINGDGSEALFNYLAVGSDSTAEAAGQTALISEITGNGLARAAATVSRITTTQTNDTARATYTWTASGSETVEEVGLFNDASAGVMLGRKLTGTVDLTSGDQLTITYDIIVS